MGRSGYSSDPVLSPRGWVAVCVAVFIGFILLIAGCSGIDSTNGGEYGVVRATSPHKNHVTKVLQPGSGPQWVGVFSTMHNYPATQRNWTFTQKEDKDGNLVGDAPAPVLPTSNGVPVAAEFTVYFQLCSSKECLTEFDNKIGNRTFDGKHPYDEGGFSKFFTQQLEPIVVGNVRRELAKVPCEDVNASCALIQNQVKVQDVQGQGQQSNTRIQAVQDAINKSLPTDVRTQLGGDYLTDVHVVFRGGDLSNTILARVNDALSAYADVSTAQAHVKKEELEAQANREKQRGYQACPACAEQDNRKAIPSGIQVWAPGNPNVSIGTGR